MGARFTLQQFSEVFKIRKPDGEHYILIGRQAVNYWAERYLADESGLNPHLPFTTLDINVCGNREDVRHIADQLNREPEFPHKNALTAMAGAIPLRIGDRNTNIEIVRTIPSVSEQINYEILSYRKLRLQ